MDLPITTSTTTRRSQQRPSRLLYWLIPAALLLGFVGVWLVAYVVLWLLAPQNMLYPRNLLSELEASYQPWGEGPGLPAIDPEAASAAERDQQRTNGPVSTVPAALVPEAQPPLTTTQSLVAAAPSPTATATPSPSSTALTSDTPTALPTDVPATVALPTDVPPTDVPPPTSNPLPTETPPAPTEAAPAPTEEALPPAAPPATSAPVPPAPTSPLPTQQPIDGQEPRPTDTFRPAPPLGTPETNPIEPPTPTRRPATATATPTATNMPVPPSATATSTRTPEPTATSTPVPPSATATSTRTPEPTATATSTRTPKPTATNAVPLAADDDVATTEDQPVTIVVLANDRDPEGQALRVVGGTRPANGSVAMDPLTQELIYTPLRDFEGNDQFSYIVEDPQGDRDSALVSIFVESVDDPPIAATDLLTATEDRAESFAVATLLANDRDIEGDVIFVTDVVSRSLRDGTVALVGNQVVYTPPPNFNSDDGIVDSFGYTIRSGSEVDEGRVQVTVLPVNDPPSFTPGSGITLRRGAAYTASWATNISAGPRNEQAQQLAFAVTATQVTTPAKQLFSRAPVIDTNGVLSFALQPDVSGVATISVTLGDSGGVALGGSNTSPTISFTVTVNDPPVGKGDQVTVVQDSLTIIDVLANDSDVDSAHDQLRVTAVTTPTQGAAQIVDNGRAVSYLPSAAGTYTFSYTLSDTAGLTSTALVTVTVTDVFNQSSCAGVVFTPQVANTADGNMQLRVTMNTTATTATVTELELRMAVGRREGKEQWANARYPAGSSVDNRFPQITFKQNAALYNPGSYGFELEYTHPITDGATADDAFRVRFKVDGKQCTAAGNFPASPLDTAVPNPPALVVAFVNPLTDTAVISQEKDALFEARAGTPDATGNPDGLGVAFVAWRIHRLENPNLDSTNKVVATVHSWNEYFAKWCAFGDVIDAGGGCAPPSGPEGPGATWLADLQPGTYRIDAYARGVNGSSSTVVSRFFTKPPKP